MDNEAIELVRWLIEDIDYGLKRLKIPIAMFQNEELEKIYKTIVQFKKKYGFVNNIELLRLSQKGLFNLELYQEHLLYENLETKDYKEGNLSYYIDYYQDLVLEKYKDTKTEILQRKFIDKEISREEFEKELNKINSFNIQTISSFNDASTIDITNVQKTYIKTNIIKLDGFIRGFALGELSIWSGGNGSSKSTFLNQMALESIEQGYNVAIYSGELTNQRLIQWITLQATNRLDIENNNGFFRPKKDAFERAISYFKDKLFIYNNEIGSKKEFLLSSIEEIIERKNIKMVIIDNLMSMELERQNKYDEQSDLAKELSSMAKKYDVHIHFVCHPRKSTGFLRKNDISGTSDLTNIADNVFIVHRTTIDFKNGYRELKGFKGDDAEIFNFTNVIEICKNREYGVVDEFVGMYFDITNHRLMNTQYEERYYIWE